MMKRIDECAHGPKVFPYAVSSSKMANMITAYNDGPEYHNW